MKTHSQLITLFQSGSALKLADLKLLEFLTSSTLEGGCDPTGDWRSWGIAEKEQEAGL